jgi:hypothetical protein
MRRELAIAIVAVATPARADVTSLVAADGYFATPDAAADVAWSAHAEWREPERGAVLDAVDRESLIGGAPRRELHELAYTDRSIDHLALTMGRFRAPGGFWLMVDGAQVAASADGIDVALYGGSRSFTNARTDTLLTKSPHPLPLVGAAITRRGDLQATLSFTLTRDILYFERGDGVQVTTTQPEQFVDAEVLGEIGEHAFITGGASVGSRYLVTYPTATDRIADDPRLENVWFGSQSLYALADWKLGALRLDASVAALRTKLGQLTSAQLAEAPTLAALSGSYLEGTTRATWRSDRTWRVDVRYRARAFSDGRRDQRTEATASWRRGVLELQAGVGFDDHRDAPAGSGLVDAATALYHASIARKTATTELAIGFAAVAAIGDEAATSPTSDPSDQRAPYTLEARNYYFVRAFAMHGAWFGGIEGEAGFYGSGLRALVQIGCSR